MLKHTQHFFGRDTHNLTALSLSSLAVIAIMPFAVYRTYVHHWPIAVIDWLIILSQLGCLYISYRYPTRRLPGITVALMFSVGSIASLYTGGVEQLYWLYPATVAAYFLTDHLRGSLITGATISIAAFTCLIPSLDAKHIVVVLFTLVATNGFGYIFAYMTARRDAELMRLARIDSLTGINNRRALNEALQTISSKQTLNNKHHFLAIIDLDNFKQINDHYGHMAGDEILVLTSKILVHFVSQPENLYRYGGDEFVYISSHTNTASLEHIFLQLQQKLADESSSNIMKQVTLSVGIAQHQDNEETAHWLQRADAALLEAKRRGKNHIQLSV